MAAVVHDALHADEADAGDAEVAHQLFRMNRTKIRILGHLVVLGRILESQVVLRQLLCLKRLLQACLAERAESEALLLNFDETDLAEGVAALQVARHSIIPVEVLVARWALHLANYSAAIKFIKLNK